MTELLSEGWGVLIDVTELNMILASISHSGQRWSVQIQQPANEPAYASITYSTDGPGDDVTTSVLEFPCFTDSFPWLTSEPLVALHPSLAQHIKKPGVQRIDPIGDFAIIWPPIHDALTIESLRGAAVIFGNLAVRNRFASSFIPCHSSTGEGEAK